MSKRITMDKADFQHGLAEPMGNLTISLMGVLQYNEDSESQQELVDELNDDWESAYSKLMEVFERVCEVVKQKADWQS